MSTMQKKSVTEISAGFRANFIHVSFYICKYKQASYMEYQKKKNWYFKKYFYSQQ